MKAKELIAELQKVDPEMEVVLMDGEFCSFVGISETKTQPLSKGNFGLEDETFHRNHYDKKHLPDEKAKHQGTYFTIE